MRPIFEYLLSKKQNKAITEPENGCTVEEIVKWLESYNVEKREFRFGPGNHHTIEKGKLFYVVGPNRNGDPNEYWVALRNYWEQNIVMKPKDRSFMSLDGEQKFISFEKAIEVAKEMIMNPNRELSYEDYK